jgi:membrane protease YdiL (CAAX protease family)
MAVALVVALVLSVAAIGVFVGVTGGSSDLIVFGIGGSVIYLSISLSFWFFAVRRRGATWDQVGFRDIEPSLILKLAGWTLLTLFMSGSVSALVEAITGESPSSAAPVFPRTPTSGELLLTIVLACLIAPIVEEFVFRGLLLGYLRTKIKLWTAVALTAGLFAIVHLIPIQLAPLFVFGMMFGFVRVRYDNVWAAVLLHAMVNGIAVWVSFALTGS